MKKDLHPRYYPQAKVVCACGHKFTTGSTLPELRVEICSACHPFFTGQEKFVDTEGRVEKFEKRRSAAQSATEKRVTKEQKKKRERARREKEVRERPKTLKEMLEKISKPDESTASH